MKCIHKFYGIKDYDELLPNWIFNKLIVGTFNPSNDFHSLNTANFFYQREKNYFWDVFPLFYDSNPIRKNDATGQKDFLKKKLIGITDILISINDADQNNEQHKKLISTVRDDDIETFNSFTWNTQQIIDVIIEKRITEVYFTKLGLPSKEYNSKDTFEYQMRLIETHCNKNSIHNKRLHSPTGMGLGKGKRVETLEKRWIDNGLIKY